jgi:anti-sigma-K factor RskA
VIAAAAPSSRETHLPAAALMAAGATLAISVEPKGGSPTGQPTGPVILSGKITLT